MVEMLSNLKPHINIFIIFFLVFPRQEETTMSVFVTCTFSVLDLFDMSVHSKMKALKHQMILCSTCRMKPFMLVGPACVDSKIF